MAINKRRQFFLKRQTKSAKILNSRLSAFVKDYKARKKIAVSRIEKQLEGKGDILATKAKQMQKYYPTEPRRKVKKIINKPNPYRQRARRKLRPSITPGTVLILVAGPLRGRRCIFLKQLENNLLLVTGPYRYSGVPLRRASQKYVIATKTKIDISNVQIPERINNQYFAKKKVKKPKRGEGDIFQNEEEKFKPSEERREDQKNVDQQLLPIIRETRFLRAYLRSKFALKRGDFPHQMVF